MSSDEYIISTHSLTRRLTRNGGITTGRSHYFNSQPHKEADLLHPANNFIFFISTHSLTRRLTLKFRLIKMFKDNFNSQPHKEADEDM